MKPKKLRNWGDDAELVAKMVEQERCNQQLKWGLQQHELCEWIAILSEEVGELSQKCLWRRFDNNVTDEEIIKEAVQVAAVASAIAQQIQSKEPV